MSLILPVILCGGSGTRLWPQSTFSKPKPFLPLLGEDTLFEATLARCSIGEGFSAPVIVTGAEHLPHVERQIGLGPCAEIIVEPTARNTAAAIALAANRVDPDTIMLVCPSDHYIGNTAAFAEAIRSAAALAHQGWLVSLGIEATTPETGFGYLKRGEPIDALGYRTAQFVEKPDMARAKTFIADGSYSWNGGIFVFEAGLFLSELARHRPAVADLMSKAAQDGHLDAKRFYPCAATFAQVESVSVDYAVMEATTKAAMVPVDMDWSDIGNWEAVHRALPRDSQGNTVRGAGVTELMDCHNVLVESDGPRVSVIGLQNVVVVVNGNEVMITSHAGAQNVGKLEGARYQVTGA